MKYALIAAALALGLIIWILVRSKERHDPPPPDAERVWFEDVAASAGIAFRHFDPATPQHLISETIGSGIAWIDYDSDGWPDLFCVQDSPFPPAAVNPSVTHKLYRNNRNGSFTDVTDAVGLNSAGYGVGVAVGDYDNDGFDDLVIAYFGRISLHHNEPDAAAPGGRRFRDVTAGSGLANPHFGTSCAWGDLDGDGLLDLFVCNYVEMDPAKPVICREETRGLVSACTPNAYPQTTCKLFRNLGKGRFADASASSGIAAAPPAASLGVAILDFDGDGKQDIYVANDMNPCYLFRNLGNLKFEECGLSVGVALGPFGSRLNGMGVAAADLDGSGRPSLFVTNFQRAPNVLLLNRGGGRFDESSYASGLAGPSLSKLGFGTCAFDADRDGNQDLAVANGHVHRTAPEVDLSPYAQESQLFLGDGTGRYRDASAAAGADFFRPRVGRGLATADFDNDGWMDLAQSGTGENAALFRNRTANDRNWVSLELIGDGKASNRNAFGSVATVEAGGKTQTQFVAGGTSYLSSCDRRLLIGLNRAEKADRIIVRWPSGRTQEFRDLSGGKRWRLREGIPVPEPAPG